MMNAIAGLYHQIYRRLKAAHWRDWEATAIHGAPVSSKQCGDRVLQFSPNSVGIGHAIDFHPCVVTKSPERPGNGERPGERDVAQVNLSPSKFPAGR